MWPRGICPWPFFLRRNILLSIIMPIYQEGEELEQLLALLRKLEASPVRKEIILVDGGSTDGSPEKLRSAGFRVLESEAGRGQQLCRGVAAAAGEHLFFLHADSDFEVDPLPEVERLLEEHSWGCFTLAFKGADWRLKSIAWGSNWRVRYRQIAFGDQGMFLRRETYEAVGGFQPIPLMEDYDLSLRLREAGVKLSQSPQVLWTSARRFKSQGVWSTLYHMQKLQAEFRRGVPAEDLAKRY